MALPTSRNTTYAPQSEVLSADLNDIQDQIVALNDAGAFLNNVTVAAREGWGDLTPGSGGAESPAATAASQDWTIPCQAVVGRTITGVRITANKANTASANFLIFIEDEFGNAVGLGAITASSASGDVAVQVTLGASEVVLDNYGIYAGFTSAASGDVLYSATFQFAT